LVPSVQKKLWNHCCLNRKWGSNFFSKYFDTFTLLLEENEKNCWFRQDWATAHIASITTGLLQDSFGDRIVGRGKWPLRSPDLTPTDFFMWGFLKERFHIKSHK
jgi:hypothetical protein